MEQESGYLQRWMIKANQWLKSHLDTKIVRHIKVKGTKHVYDGDNMYWAKRNAKNPLLPTQVKKLLSKQKGICPVADLLEMTILWE